MATHDQTTIHNIRKNSGAPRFSIMREILIWHSAWQEYHRLQQLDGEALRDMGLSVTDREAVTLGQIAARKRHRA